MAKNQSQSQSRFAFKPEIEQDIIITHPDLVGEAEYNFKKREEIFNNKYGRRILVGKITHEIFYEECLKEKRAKILKEEEAALKFIENFEQTENWWLSNDEERRLFVEHYVEEIRMEVDKRERCESWVKEHFF